MNTAIRVKIRILVMDAYRFIEESEPDISTEQLIARTADFVNMNLQERHRIDNSDVCGILIREK